MKGFICSEGVDKRIPSDWSLRKTASKSSFRIARYGARYVENEVRMHKTLKFGMETHEGVRSK